MPKQWWFKFNHCRRRRPPPPRPPPPPPPLPLPPPPHHPHYHHHHHRHRRRHHHHHHVPWRQAMPSRIQEILKFRRAIFKDFHQHAPILGFIRQNCGSIERPYLAELHDFMWM